MKLKWGGKKKHWAEVTDNYFIALVLITCVVATIWLWVKIFQVWKIHLWLQSL